MTDDTATGPFAPAARRQLAVTWGIPDEYGGMTAALLRRSRAFARAGTRVDVLTFEPLPDYEEVRQRLRDRGELVDGMRLRNIYEDFRESAREPVTVAVRPGSLSRPHDDESVTIRGSVRRWRRGESDARVEHRRSDGSLALLDERRRGGGRLITSFDRTGRTTGQWTSASAFRFAWIDELLAGEPAVAIVDSKTVARWMQTYRRPNVALVHMVHGAHHDARGRLTDSRRPVFENLHRWDAVVFLTARQRAAAIELLGDSGNLHVIPNAVTTPDRMPRLPPDRLHGVIVARLSGIKRLDHALRVIAAVRALDIPVTAEIIGEGDRRARLEAEAERLGLQGVVRFTGYIPRAAERYAGGSWTLLTSRSEGESMSLVEAMAAGCLPVAYDIRYGPAEVIADGRNGRLVPDGDIERATQALAGLCVLDDDALAATRRQARRTAERHNDRAVFDLWTEALGSAIERAAARTPLDNGALGRVRVRRLRGRLLVTARLPRGPRPTRIEVGLSTRESIAALVPMRRFGRWRFARLDREGSARLSGETVKTRFVVHVDGAVVGVDAGMRHPDQRSLARRAADRLRR
ncbi:glycosyltransferase [Microbacterium yannicii]|uniref:glycosyltransferase n=1 Tax=Microbacterium yannicii TaxID=671622 RepID=UPI0002F64AAA|nr:glycosyltransferase [Microbacterium yannicii]